MVLGETGFDLLWLCEYPWIRSESLEFGIADKLGKDVSHACAF
jgi:hypothetical protein